MYTLSIDPGHSYCAYAILNDNIIIDIGIREFFSNDFYKSLREYIEEIKNNNYDLIVFENQPLDNYKTNLIKNIFQYELNNLIIFNPTYKLYDIKIKNYKDRKNKSIELAEQILKKFNPDLYNKKFIYFIKKDDLADSLNQGLSYYLKNSKDVNIDFKDFIKEIINLI